jgi:hypothetical protein
MQQTIELKDEERTRCEIWTRVMGYHRPISAFNPGKQSEQAERLYFKQDRTSAWTRTRATSDSQGSES